MIQLFDTNSFRLRSCHTHFTRLLHLFLGGIAVGLYHQLGHDEISKVALECKADVIVVENENLLKKVLLVQHKLPDLKAIVQLVGEPPLSDKRRLHKTHKVRQDDDQRGR